MSRTVKWLQKCGFSWDNTMLFYIPFFLMAFAKAFGLDKGNAVYYLLFAGSAMLLGIRILYLLKKDMKLIVRIALLLISCGVFFVSSRKTALLFTGLFLAASKDIDFELAIKGCVTSYLIAIPLRVSLYFLGFVEGGSKKIVVWINDQTQYLADITYGYGYNHPNVFMAVVVIAVLLLLYIRRERLTLPLFMTTSAFVVVVFMLTKGKTGLIIYLATLIGLLLLNLPQAYSKKIFVFYCLILIFVTLVMGILLPLFYSPQNLIMKLMNHKLVTGRFANAQSALKAVGIHLFGNGRGWSDILYIDMLLTCGIAGLVMIMFGAVALFVAFFKDRNWTGLLGASVMILYASMEQFPLNIAMNPFLLYIGTAMLYRTEKTDLVKSGE